jgi:TorA maturation chaperone TorD/divalent metal cation (Fe/Co/Zn/Cd) transporter
MQSIAILKGVRREAATTPIAVAASHEQGRASLYALTATLLLPASVEDADRLLAALRDTDVKQSPADPPLSQALNALALAARAMDTEALAEEYATIFIDATRPRVDPSASRYCNSLRSGSTLACVRAALRELGLVRRDGIAEMEDHLGMLCEAMRVLVGGAPGVAPRPLLQQRAFFAAHLAPWYRACANDIRSAKGANFFCRVADVMEAFLDVEAQAFAIDGIGAGQRSRNARRQAAKRGTRVRQRSRAGAHGGIESSGLRRDRRQRRDRDDQVHRGGDERQLRDAVGRHPLDGRCGQRGFAARRHPPFSAQAFIEHPFGHGKELYFWSLIVAVLIFGVGGGVSAYEGILHMLDPEPLQDAFWSYVVLGAAAVFEGASFAIAARQFWKEKGDAPLWTALRHSKDPSTYTVLAEDSAALAGLIAAALGVWASHALDLPAIDGAASIVIGVLLACVAVLLIREARGLLIGEGIRPETAKAIRDLVLETDGVREAGWPLSMYIGPEEVLLTLDAAFDPKIRPAKSQRPCAGSKKRSASAIRSSSASTSSPRGRDTRSSHLRVSRPGTRSTTKPARLPAATSFSGCLRSFRCGCRRGFLSGRF